MLRPKDLGQDSGTKTFLDAMNSGKVHLARFVLDAMDGRIINSKTENSKTPLMFAISLPDPGLRMKFTRLLLEKGADVNCQEDQGRTALSLACELGHLDVVKLLVQFNADPEIQDAWGNNALMYAACSGHSQVLEFLIRAFKRLGLKLDRTNHAGHSAIQVANLFGHSQCVQALNIPGNRCPGSEDQLLDMKTKELGEPRHPTRLPKQVLERFTKQFQDKCEDRLPTLFQKQLRVGDGIGLRKRVKAQNQSPDRKCQHQPFISHLKHVLHYKDSQDTTSGILFTAKQVQNCRLKNTRGSKTLESTTENPNEEEHKESTDQQGALETFNFRVKSTSFTNDKDGLFDVSDAYYRAKGGPQQLEQVVFSKRHDQAIACSLINNTPLNRTVSEHSLEYHNDSQRAVVNSLNSYDSEVSDINERLARSGQYQKRLSLPFYGRPDKLLAQREEVSQENILPRPAGISTLGTRLLRRLTAPEFLRLVKEFPSDSESGRGKMSRSETYPLSKTHQKVNNQASIDSISGVKCEFENNGANVVYYV
ncbi:ANR63 protein, partial [Polyodon spathula]|nr:uveal autoantigen with coiled-coil domains and ankyrin repeats [Polyodon spathula]MBN3277673.1 ANR63 protein [Polyodon spathula]